MCRGDLGDEEEDQVDERELVHAEAEAAVPCQAAGRVPYCLTAAPALARKGCEEGLTLVPRAGSYHSDQQLEERNGAESLVEAWEADGETSNGIGEYGDAGAHHEPDRDPEDADDADR